ncbi:MAG TPA: mannitol dehydrogenase family protein [Croceibacterium sp.]
MRLSPATLDRLPADVACFDYDRDAQAVGIVHFGLGAFHRAHEAWYTDLAISGGERGWGIAGVSLRSDGVARQLSPQDSLYSLTERGGAGDTTRIVGSVREALVGERDRAAIVRHMAMLECHVVSFTVTEKGYARAADGSLDSTLAEASFYQLLAEGLAERRNAGLPGLTLLSCDNLPGNGRQLERLVRQWLALREPDLVGWFEAECRCPNTMVDRIVPATTPGDLDSVEGCLGLRDEGAVFAEPFSQWVIEDRFAGPCPGWDKVGAQLVADVAPYETAKLRVLNGAHSAMAYLGLERGHEFVDQAIADPALRPLVEQLMRREAAASFEPARGQDLGAYADALLARFANPALRHRLAQIAMDGSQKIPQRWLASLAVHQRRGEWCQATLTALAAWLRHVRGGAGVDDPLAGELAAAWRENGASGIVPALFGPGGLLASPWRPNAVERAFIEGAL